MPSSNMRTGRRAWGPRAGTLALLAVIAGGVVPSAQQPKSGPAPIAWSAGRSLSWNDYLGPPQPGSDAAAMTVYRLSYEEECAGDTFTFRVVSFFEPAQSWVKPSVLTNAESSLRLLVHEQGHFDLSEVQARKLRRTLRELVRPCRMTADERQALVTRHMRDDAEAQGRYDVDTSYGRNEGLQTRAIFEIARQLKELSAFSALLSWHGRSRGPARPAP